MGYIVCPYPVEVFVRDPSVDPEKEPKVRSRAGPTNLSRAPYLFPTNTNANGERLREEAVAAPQALSIGGPSFLPPPREGNSSGLTLNRYWRLFNDPRFSPPILNPELPAITAKAFLGLTHQEQALGGMMQVIILHIP
ncbi:hypothetical protein BHE74_00009790 [Ensete ventricosum]|nr:hypothetical protein BHE74_00009790 [Ensete ventricosum]